MSTVPTPITVYHKSFVNSGSDTWNGMSETERMKFRFLKFKCVIGFHSWTGAVRGGGHRINYEYCPWCKQERPLPNA